MLLSACLGALLGHVRHLIESDRVFVGQHIVFSCPTCRQVGGSHPQPNT